jgi:hypothetical protein
MTSNQICATTHVMCHEERLWNVIVFQRVQAYNPVSQRAVSTK